MASLKSKIKSKSFFIYSILIHIFLSIIVIVISFNFFVPNVYKHMVRHYTASGYGDENIVVIAIDDKSVERHRWPWKRELYAKIFNYFNEYAKPQIIGFDSTPGAADYSNPLSDKIFHEALKHTDKLVVGFAPNILPYEDNHKDFDTKFKNKFAVNIEDKRSYIPPTKYHSINFFPENYFNSVQNAGSVSCTKNDKAGYLSYADQIITVNGTSYPTFALRLYMLLNDTDKLTLTDDGILVDKTNLKIQTFSSWEGMRNPVHFYKVPANTEYTHKKYSAIDIMDSYDLLKSGKQPIINPEEFNGKIVLVGGNAKATSIGLADNMPTPVMHEHPGVDIQATILDNLINNQTMTLLQPLWWIFTIIALSVYTFIIICKFSFFRSLIVLIVSAFVYYIFCANCFRNDIQVDVITPLLIQTITMIFGYSFRFILEGKNKEKIKQAMGRYLSQDIMKSVVKNIDDIKLGGKKAAVTVLFADIRGFTSMSEKMTAEEVSIILNEYFSEIEPIITKYNGVINKFIGDAVMAIFGEPIQDINHPSNAVKCAFAMLKKVDWLQDKWLNEGKPRIEIGIGINTGEAFVGNIGSEKRLEYTVIGDTVNLASRIESYNKVYKTHLLISSATYHNVSSIVDVIKISEVTIRGKSKKTDIYEVLRVNGDD